MIFGHNQDISKIIRKHILVVTKKYKEAYLGCDQKSLESISWLWPKIIRKHILVVIKKYKEAYLGCDQKYKEAYLGCDQKI